MFIVAKITAGSTIEEAVQRAINLAKITMVDVQFEFNSVMVMVGKDTIHELAVGYYHDNKDD